MICALCIFLLRSLHLRRFQFAPGEQMARPGEHGARRVSSHPPTQKFAFRESQNL